MIKKSITCKKSITSITRKNVVYNACNTCNTLNTFGISLIEVLVTVSIFAVLGILITRAILLSVGGSKKSESLIKVRDTLNYSMSVMERQLRNANSMVLCPNPDSTYLAYYDQYGNQTYFQCQSNAGIGFIASGSAVLTGTDVNVILCSFACTPGVGANPPIVTISLEAKSVGAIGTQNADVTLNSQITLRNY